MAPCQRKKLCWKWTRRQRIRFARWNRRLFKNWSGWEKIYVILEKNSNCSWRNTKVGNARRGSQSEKPGEKKQNEKPRAKKQKEKSGEKKQKEKSGEKKQKDEPGETNQREKPGERKQCVEKMNASGRQKWMQSKKRWEFVYNMNKEWHFFRKGKNLAYCFTQMKRKAQRLCLLVEDFLQKYRCQNMMTMFRTCRVTLNFLRKLQKEKDIRKVVCP